MRALTQQMAASAPALATRASLALRSKPVHGGEPRARLIVDWRADLESVRIRSMLGSEASSSPRAMPRSSPSGAVASERCVCMTLRVCLKQLVCHS